MTSDVDAFAAAFRRAVVVPVIRTTDPALARRRVVTLVGLGVEVVELTTTVPGWAGLVRELRRELPHVLTGVGTVTCHDLAQEAVDGGAQFLVTPFRVDEVRAVADESSIPLVEGGWSPGELAQAVSRGVAKFFPAQVGGLAHLRSVLDVLPAGRVVPTGGVTVADAAAWLDAGALAVGIGATLFDGDTVDPGLPRLLSQQRGDS